MEIKDRLIKIITSEGLNSSAFADSIGVQRSSISHILSGRNKPSIDFLEKILSSYPKYNAEWLIMGTGDISKSPKQASLFNVEPANPEDINPKSKPEPMQNKQIDESILLNRINESLSSELIKESMVQDEKPIGYSKPPNSSINNPKTIERIVIFYSDRTFFEYLPAN
jgi:transcriptional regulator with XRE-family HTH domain